MENSQHENAIHFLLIENKKPLSDDGPSRPWTQVLDGFTALRVRSNPPKTLVENIY